MIKHGPGGSHPAMKIVTPEGEKLFAIGYKYCKKNVFIFCLLVMRHGLKLAKPYKARFKDKNGNSVHRDVPRPE